MPKHKLYMLALIPLFLIGASDCEADTDIKIDIDYPRCVSNAILDPHILPTFVDDKSYFKMCWDHKIVHITCHSQFMIMTKTDDYCIVPGTRHESKSAKELGLMD